MEIEQISLDQRNDIVFPKYSYFRDSSDEKYSNSSSDSTSAADDPIHKSISDLFG